MSVHHRTLPCQIKELGPLGDTKDERPGATRDQVRPGKKEESSERIFETKCARRESNPRLADFVVASVYVVETTRARHARERGVV